MKILYLSNSRIPSFHANSVHVMKMCSSFHELGHPICLFAKKGDKVSANPFEFYGVNPNFRIHYFNMRSLQHRSSLKKKFYRYLICKQIKRFAPELIYSRNAPALAAISGMRISFIYEAHRFPPETHIENFLFAQHTFKRLVVISQALKGDYLQAFPGLPASKVLVAHDGADTSRSALGTPKKFPGFNVGYVGNLYRGKGMELIAELTHRCPWANFHIVGGYGHDLDFWKSRLAEEPNITFYGFIPHKETGDFISAFDVVLAPYQHHVEVPGGFDISRWMSPLKIFEYMSFGKAIVASDLPVLKEVLENGRNAVLVPPNDPEAWAGAISSLFKDQPYQHQLGQAALRDFLSKHTWAERAKRTISCLTD
jgi:glycosyltransferase involved in cell wall biosynthesis